MAGIGSYGCHTKGFNTGQQQNRPTKGKVYTKASTLWEAATKEQPQLDTDQKVLKSLWWRRRGRSWWGRRGCSISKEEIKIEEGIRVVGAISRAMQCTTRWQLKEANTAQFDKIIIFRIIPKGGDTKHSRRAGPHRTKLPYAGGPPTTAWGQERSIRYRTWQIGPSKRICEASVVFNKGYAG